LQYLEAYNLNKSLFGVNNSSFKKRFDIFLSTSFIISKIKSLNLLHSLKSSPTSNSKLLLLQDIDIIKYYGDFAYDILNWYRCCYNFSKLKFIIELLRQSCLMTLARKHNKRKTWAYFVFTSELLVFKGLFYNRRFFPSRKYLVGLKRKFLVSTTSFNSTLNNLMFLS